MTNQTIKELKELEKKDVEDMIQELEEIKDQLHGLKTASDSFIEYSQDDGFVSQYYHAKSMSLIAEALLLLADIQSEK